MKPLFFSLLLCLFSTLLTAQPTITWQKCLGGSDLDQTWDFVSAGGNQYFIACATASHNGDVSGAHGSNDVWIIKVTDTGDILWNRTYGGSGQESINSIHQTPDGGAVFLAETSSNDGDVTGYHGGIGGDIWLVKLDAEGNIQWQKTYGGTDIDSPGAVFPLSDGGYMLGGSTYSKDGDVTLNKGQSDAWVIRVDSVGAMLWQRTYGGSGYESASLLPAGDGNFLILSRTDSYDGDIWNNHGNWDAWVAKIGADGTILWKKTYGGTALDLVSWVIPASDGGYWFSGISKSNNINVSGNHGLSDGWVMKLSATGAIQWSKLFGGSADDYFGRFYENADHDLVLSGYTESYDGDISNYYGGGDNWFLKVHPNGDLAWEKTYGGSGYEGGANLLPAQDGGYMMASSTMSNDHDVSGNHGFADVWLAKLSPEAVGTSDPAAASGLDLYPNPAAQSIRISLPTGEPVFSLRITDLAGRELIGSQTLQNGAVVDISALPNGLFLASATTPEGKVLVQKCMKME